MPDSPEATTTIAEHLVRRLRELGVDQGFGIVGDFALRLFGQLTDAGFPILVTADEQGAAFAADAYARLRGFGVVAVTYGVGGLKVANATAGAWAEQVPLLVVSGAAGMAERRGDPMLHHKVKSFDTQLDVFRDLTVAQAVLSDPLTAAAEIDRVLGAMFAAQRPGYIEVPRDIAAAEIRAVEGPLPRELPPLDEPRLAAAVADVMARLLSARSAVIVAGVLAWRRRLAEPLRRLALGCGIPVTGGFLSKGLFPERHPLSLGVYMGAVSREPVVTRVEGADLLLGFGALVSDLSTGAFTAVIDRDRVVECTDTDVAVGPRTYRNVPLWAFLPALAEAAGKAGVEVDHATPEPLPGFVARRGVALSVEGVMACVAAAIDERHGLIVEPGECLFASVNLPAPSWCLASAYYATLGYAVPAALGAGKADPGHRPVVLVGDGAFLMTGLEAMTAAFHGVHPIVLVLDNEGYGTQRPMRDGPFNDVPALRSEELPRAFGTGRGRLCTTEDELQAALAEAVSVDELFLIRAKVPRARASEALTRLTRALGKRA